MPAAWRRFAVRRRNHHKQEPRRNGRGLFPYVSDAISALHASAARLRRHQPRRPPHAAIKPGKPAPTTGPGTAVTPISTLPVSSFETEPNPTKDISTPTDEASVVGQLESAGVPWKQTKPDAEGSKEANARTLAEEKSKNRPEDVAVNPSPLTS